MAASLVVCLAKKSVGILLRDNAELSGDNISHQLTDTHDCAAECPEAASHQARSI